MVFPRNEPDGTVVEFNGYPSGKEGIRVSSRVEGRKLELESRLFTLYHV